jgi:hypothetical protein
MSRPATLTFTGNGGPLTAAEIITALAAADPGSVPVFKVTVRGKAKAVTIETADQGAALSRVAGHLVSHPQAPPPG